MFVSDNREASPLAQSPCPLALPVLPAGGKGWGLCSKPRCTGSLLHVESPPGGRPHLKVTTSNTLPTSRQSLCFPIFARTVPPCQPAGLPWEEPNPWCAMYFFSNGPFTSWPLRFPPPQVLPDANSCALRLCPTSGTQPALPNSLPGLPELCHVTVSTPHSLRILMGSEFIHWLCDLSIHLTLSEPLAPNVNWGC